MADKRFTLVPLEFFEDEQTETLFIITTRSGKTKLCNTTFCEKNNAVVLFSMDKSARSFLKRTISRCKILFAGKLVHRIFLQQKPPGQQSENVRICGKMPPTCIATTAITCCLPTPLNVNRQRTASITYYIYGSNSALNRNVTKCTHR